MEKKFVFVIGEKLTALRQASGLDQGQLGDKIGVSRQTINTWEGKSSVKLTSDQANKLMKALHVEMSVLTSDKINEVQTDFKHQIFEGDYIGMHQRAWNQFEQTMDSQRELLKTIASTNNDLGKAFKDLAKSLSNSRSNQHT